MSSDRNNHTSQPRKTRRARRWPLILAALALAGAGLYVALRITLTVPPQQALSEGRELLRAPTVLAVVAHPDDLEWYIGGTLRRLADEGANVQVIVATNGEKGPNHIKTPDLPATRREEQLAAADINGYDRVHFLNLPDRGVAADERFLPAVREIYEAVSPDAVFIFDPHLPSLPYLHPDHQGSARVFLEYWRTLGENRPPLYLFQTRRPDTAVDITPVIDTKERALAQHRSQNSGMPGFMRRVHASYGEHLGVPYAELYRQLW